MFDPRKNIKIDSIPVEKKSTIVMGDGLSFPEFLSASGNGDLSAYAAILLYMQAMPLFNAISLRAELLSQIPIRVMDTKTGKFVEDHDSLELLKRPNADMSQSEFIEQIASYYDITGDSFLVSTGNFNKPPLEISTIPPQTVTFGLGNKFGILHVPDQIWITMHGSGNMAFKAEDIIDRGIRFLNTQRGEKELWHIRTFNPLRSSSQFRGLSKARPIWFEIQQYLSGNVTNLSMLKRGTRVSMAWINNRGEELTDKQWERMQEEAQKYSGESNAGGTPILDGMDVKLTGQSNRDMEFKDLQESMLARISTTYRIPLALLLSQSMTLNNLETSMLQLFDNAVIPLGTRLYDELTRFLMPRYENSENLIFTYNENDIAPLRERVIARAEKLRTINVNTDNEIRAVLGDEPLQSGGDVIYRPATLVPSGESEFGDEEIDEPTQSKFRRLLLERGYKDEEVAQICEDSGM